MFENLSIQKKINYFITMVTVSIFVATIFVFLAMSHIEKQYKHLNEDSMQRALQTLEIEKNLNYVSRTSRDIMLSGDFTKGLSKLNDTIENIRSTFISLEDGMAQSDSLYMVQDAKKSTMLFLDNNMIMMKGLSETDIKNNKTVVYQRYKKELTPYANASRDSF